MTKNVVDELVTAWGIVADLAAWTKVTGEVEGFDDGTVKPYGPSDRSVFRPDGGVGEVGQLLVITTQLFEWDAGDVAAANEALGFIGDLSDELAKALATSAPPVAAVAGIIALLTPFVQKAVAYFGGDPDPLGTQQLAWTSLELQQLTAANPQGTFDGTLPFRNGDATGAYDLTYEVARVAQ